MNGVVKSSLFFLLSIVLLFAVVSLLMLFPDMNSEVFAVIIISAEAFHLGCGIYLILSIAKAIKNKAASRNRAPEQVVCEKITVSGEDIRESKTYTYNKREVFRYKSSKNDLSWGIILVLCVVFFPAGLYFAAVKIYHEKSLYHENGIVLAIFGAVVACLPIAVFSLFAWGSYRLGDSLENIEMFLKVGIVTSIPGMILFAVGCYYRRKGKLYNRYLTLITNKKITKIDRIAAEMNTTEAKAIKTIESIIRDGLLADAYIYFADQQVVVPGIAKKISVKCIHCGGTTVIYDNENRICKYCGEKI